MYKVGLDCRLAGTAHAGLGRYTGQLIKHLLLQHSDDIVWVLFFFSEKQAKEVLGDAYTQPNIKTVIASIPHYSLAEQLKMPRIYRQEKLDLLHVPHFNVPLFYRGSFVVTIHDLLWHEMKGSRVTTLPPHLYWLKYLFYRLVTRVAVARSKRILVPSETVRRTIEHYYSQAEDKTVITLEGTTFKEVESEVKRKEKQLLYVGSLYPHKNIQVVLEALTELPDYKLHLVGSRNIFQEEVRAKIKKLKLEDQVKFLGYLTDEELIKEYQEATAFVFPSLSEGFGLPGLEALKMNTPLLAADIPVFREVYAEHAQYFDPNSSHDLKQKIEQLKTVDSEKTQTFIKRYSWAQMAKKTLNTYYEVLQSQ